MITKDLKVCLSLYLQLLVLVRKNKKKSSVEDQENRNHNPKPINFLFKEDQDRNRCKRDKTWDILKDSNGFDFEENDASPILQELLKPDRNLSFANHLDAKINDNSMSSNNYEVINTVDDPIDFSRNETSNSNETGCKFIPIDELLHGEPKKPRATEIKTHDWNNEIEQVLPQKRNYSNSLNQNLFPVKSNQNNEVEDWSYGFEWDRQIESINYEIFGNQSFRPKQREIINATKYKRDVIALIPTGGGKSLTFQLSSQTEDGVTLVIMPLLSLINDQVMQMTEIGVQWLFLHTSNDISKVFSDLTNGSLTNKLLFLTPEKITQSNQAKSLIEALYLDRKLERFVIDEVHCVSSWGQDFRPDYLSLSILKESFPDIPILGLTATATHEVKMDIIRLLKLKNALCFQSSFNRPNLFYQIKTLKKSKWEEDIAKIWSSNLGNSGIIYCIRK